MSDASISRQIVLGSRVLARKGVLDGFGHVSHRSAARADHFLLSRSKAPATIGLDDVLLHDLDGAAVEEPRARVFLERFLHAEIYRAHPEVTAIVHSHSPEVIPFTVVPDMPLRPISHLCGFLAGTARPFDVADHAGPGSDLLLRNAELARSFAPTFGEAAIGLMRGHGFTAVGGSIEEAVFRAVYTTLNCSVQLAALRLGDPVYLTDAEAAACEETTRPQMRRAWDLWIGEIADQEGLAAK